LKKKIKRANKNTKSNGQKKAVKKSMGVRESSYSLLELNQSRWSSLKPLLVGLLLFLLAIYVFFALSARNEIYYLCGNFKSGIYYSSVVRQLDTTNLSNYKIEKSEQGKRVTHSSALHLNLVRCEITFDEDKKVSHAIYK
jgi:hypothetical protein